MSRARWLFEHRADLLAALVYLCLAYLSFNALADYANAHTISGDGKGLFPQPYGGWALAVAVDGSVLYAFISYRRARRMATVLLVVGASTTYLLQRWHAEGELHPLIVAGVVPGLMVLVTFAWHLIRDTSRDPAATPERPAQRRDGPPDALAGSVAAAGKPAIQVGVAATPPQNVSAPAATGAAERVEDAEGENLPEPSPSVKGRDETVTLGPYTARSHRAEYAALYRQRAKRDGFEQAIVRKDLDRDAAYATAARNGWPVANGHREEAPA